MDRRAPGLRPGLLPVRSGRAYGNRLYHPVFEAIARHDLVAEIRRGGSNDTAPPSSLRCPSWYADEYVSELQVFEARLASIVGEGLFQAEPSLRVSFLECGFTWVPGWLWNLDRVWKGTRREIPWVEGRPFELSASTSGSAPPPFPRRPRPVRSTPPDVRQRR